MWRRGYAIQDIDAIINRHLDDNRPVHEIYDEMTRELEELSKVVYYIHRRTSQRGWEAAAPPDSGKTIIFRAKANFLGAEASSQKWKKTLFFVFIRKKRNSFCRARKTAQNPGFLLIITGWGESGNVILQVSMAFFRALSKNFSGKDGSAPLEKIGLYAYDYTLHQGPDSQKDFMVSR